jgi:predicted nucleic acid-binding protein
MRVIDSSFLVAAVDNDDPRQAAARSKLAEADPLLIPLAVLGEFLDLLAYRAGRDAARAADHHLQALPHLTVRHAGDPDASLRLWRSHPELSLADYIGIQACLETGADLLTFDRKQLAALPAR